MYGVVFAGVVCYFILCFTYNNVLGNIFFLFLFLCAMYVLDPVGNYIPAFILWIQTGYCATSQTGCCY